MKNCFIQNHFNPKAQLIFTWNGNQFYQKQFVVVEQEFDNLHRRKICGS